MKMGSDPMMPREPTREVLLAIASAFVNGRDGEPWVKEIYRALYDRLAHKQAALSVPVGGAPAKNDAMADSHYLAGVGAGWNAAQAPNPNEALAALYKSRAGYLQAIKSDSASVPVEGRERCNEIGGVCSSPDACAEAKRCQQTPANAAYLFQERMAEAAENAQLPEGYQWGHDAMEQFDFGKKCAALAIRALSPSPGGGGG